MCAVFDKLAAALADASDVYINTGVDAEEYIEGLRQDIWRNRCEPYQVTAKVMPPGFPDLTIGDELTGLCIARRAGYWLVYAPEKDVFYCFWGNDEQNLGAHGVFGSPLYCWSA
jgi:hypothetical protein